MKKLFTLVCAMLLGATLTFAQTGGGTTGTDKGSADTSSTSGKKGGKKGHKGGKKSKKGAGDSGTTTPPK